MEGTENTNHDPGEHKEGVFKKALSWLAGHKWAYALVVGVPVVIIYYLRTKAASNAGTATGALSYSPGSSSGGGGGSIGADNSSAIQTLQNDVQGLTTQQQTDETNSQTFMQQVTATLQQLTGGLGSVQQGLSQEQNQESSDVANLQNENQGLAGQFSTALSNLTNQLTQGLANLKNSFSGNTSSGGGSLNETAGGVNNGGYIQETGPSSVNPTSPTEQPPSGPDWQNIVGEALNSVLGDESTYANTPGGSAAAHQAAVNTRNNLASQLAGASGWSTSWVPTGQGYSQLRVSGPNGFTQTI